MLRSPRAAVFTPGIFGKLHRAKVTSVLSAIFGYVLAGGSLPSFTHWSMSVISARQYHWIGIRILLLLRGVIRIAVRRSSAAERLR